jgi:hypothetical protein
VPPFDRSQNAFDRTERSDVVLRVVVGPTVADFASPAQREILTDVNGFEGIKLVIVSAGGETLREFAGAEFLTGVVENENHNYILREPRRLRSLMSEVMVKMWYQEPSLAPADAWLEHVVVNHDSDTDLVVGSTDAVRCLARHEGTTEYCDFEDFVRRVRFFLLATHRTQVGPRHFVNEGLYFLYRMRVLFPELAKAQVRLHTARTTSASGDLQESEQSLIQRLEFFVEACERACIEGLKTQNRDTESRALYHLNYLCVLATAALEDLARILCYHCGLSFKDKQGLTLRRRGNGRESELTAALRIHLPSAYAVLSDQAVVDFIAALFSLRDAIQHREHPQVLISSLAGSLPRPDAILLPAACMPPIETYSRRPISTQNWKRLIQEGKTLAGSYSLALAVHYGTVRLINGLLASIRWSDGFSSSSDTAKARAWKDHSRWDQGVAPVLNIAHSSPLLDPP